MRNGRLRTLPPVIGKLKHSETLALMGDLESLPQEIGNLTSLKRVSWAIGNAVFPREIAQLTSLKELVSMEACAFESLVETAPDLYRLRVPLVYRPFEFSLVFQQKAEHFFPHS
jgi:hypothetical protein